MTSFPRFTRNLEGIGLCEAWSNAMGAVSPPRINKPPEEADFPQKNIRGQIPEAVKFKDPAKTSKLIKKIAHELGSPVASILPGSQSKLQ